MSATAPLRLGKKLGVCWVIFIEHLEKRIFRNGDSIILLHRALVRCDLEGLKSPKPRFSWFGGSLEISPAILFDSGSPYSLQNYFKITQQKTNHFRNILVGKSPNLRNHFVRKDAFHLMAIWFLESLELEIFNSSIMNGSCLKARGSRPMAKKSWR